MAHGTIEDRGWKKVDALRSSAIHHAAFECYEHATGYYLVLLSFWEFGHKPTFTWRLLMRIRNHLPDYVGEPGNPPLQWASAIIKSKLGDEFVEE